MRAQPPEEIRSRARFVLATAIVVDIAAIAALLLPLARGGEVTDLLPLALLLFVASSGLLLASIGLRKKADQAERET